ncbi:hypothetical protein C7M84_006260 [Penaeus vannamei]|uniref:Uncharacterized protein n=1 Tax=Penaeus vannamei TaxID=6689 RepID=A0A423TFI7_PENVA|nr:hypothetical protein C7M84_006260 [Penaeus vannamei]
MLRVPLLPAPALHGYRRRTPVAGQVSEVAPQSRTCDREDKRPSLASGESRAPRESHKTLTAGRLRLRASARKRSVAQVDLKTKKSRLAEEEVSAALMTRNCARGSPCKQPLSLPPLTASRR